MLSGLLFVVLAPVLAQSPPPRDPGTLTISAPRKILSLNTKAMRGTPSRLSWSPDGTRLYVRLSEFDRWANETARHYVVDVAARTTTPVEQEPPWAIVYWSWKAAQAAPERPDFALSVEIAENLARTTNVPREGNIGQSKSDPTSDPNGIQETVAAAMFQNQKVEVRTLTLRRQVVSQTVNAPMRPGATYSWSPADLGLIAYADQKGRLALLGQAGRPRTVSKTKNVLCPAWSDDGRDLAFFQKASRTRFDLMLAGVGW